MAPASQNPKPNSWSVVAIVFIALFVLVLFASSLVIGYLYHQNKQQKNTNPYPHGSGDWLDFERTMMDPQAERDALAIATLESRIAVQEQYSQEADRMIELLDRSQKHLTLQLRDEQRKSDPVDPEVFQRIYNEIHKPVEQHPARPSTLPLAANSPLPEQPTSSRSAGAVASSSSITQSTPLTPSVTDGSPITTQSVRYSPPLNNQRPTILLQTAKLGKIVRSNSRPSPARSTRFIEHHVEPLSVTLVDPAEFEDVQL